ncbi:hypothetical protein DERP_003075, partial [Dermatophagoides pteronyssinus]
KSRCAVFDEHFNNSIINAWQFSFEIICIKFTPHTNCILCAVPILRISPIIELYECTFNRLKSLTEFHAKNCEIFKKNIRLFCWATSVSSFVFSKKCSFNNLTLSSCLPILCNDYNINGHLNKAKIHFVD